MYPLLPRTRQADFAGEMSRDLKKNAKKTEKTALHLLKKDVYHIITN